MIKILIAILYFKQIQSNLIGLYDSQIDNIEILDANNFNQVVYNNDLNASQHRIIKASFVEFYAHWCGGCRRYARHWKNLAKETKLWHHSVIRVAAINCGDYRNEILCRQHNIQYYPTLKLFPAYAKFENKNQDGLLVKDNHDNLEHLMEKMILFIELSANKPPQWPNLEPYKSNTLNSLFIDKYKKSKSALLVFESDYSMIGRKLILDFSSFSNNILIRRIVPTSNSNLTNKFVIDTNRLPILYLVKNTHSTMMKYELFDQKLVENYQKEYFKLLSNQNITISEEIKNENEHIRFKKMIFKFIEYANLIEKEETRLKQNSSIDAFSSVKNENKSHKHRIYLEDLETGLNIMLRSDIAKKQFINGSEMIALKNWIRVLTKFFPARRPVRHFLRNLNSKLNLKSEITGSYWLSLLDDNKTNSFLPNEKNFFSCRGSFRGYPCTLWILFHTLTVRQYEMEMDKKEEPFKSNYNVTDVIEGIRDFVLNFFGCRECSQNFGKETDGYLNYLKNPQDPVLYLWKVHNNVNKRLSVDETHEQDIENPKVQFPTQKQCPMCHVKIINASQDEYEWNEDEVLKFLTHYYSKHQIKHKSNRTTSLSLHAYSSFENDYNFNASFKLVELDELEDDQVIQKSSEINNNNNGKNIIESTNQTFLFLYFGFLLVILKNFSC